MEVDRKWEEHQLPSGYVVFYSPVADKTNCLIVGINPGGDVSAFNRDTAKLVPSEHEYLTEDYPMAQKMKQLFEGINQFEVLESSLKINRIFFRSTGQDEWNELEKPIREELEAFCADKVKEIIKYTQPKVILSEGITNFHALKKILGSNWEDIKEIKDGKYNIYLRARSGTTNLIGIKHPTGFGGPSKAQWELISNNLKEDLKELI